MSSVATAHVPVRPLRPSRGALAAAVALVAATASVLLRWHGALPFPQFLGACQRLRASGLPVTDRDWFCLPTPLSARVSYAAAQLLVALALVLPCAILAATGRRWSSLTPLLVAPFLNPPVFATSWWDAGLHRGGIVLMGTNVLVLAAPVAALWFVAPPRARRDRPHMVAALAVGSACTLASLGVWVWARHLVAAHWASMGGGVEIGYLTPSAVAMALFAAMLGTDRRWWPWALVPTALLLSMGPSAALVWSPERLTDWSFFGGVAPLVAIGLIWSVGSPLSRGLTARRHRGDGSTGLEGEATARMLPRRRRWSLELNVGAAALLVLSVAMFRSDPLPVQEAASLPTYLGERLQAQDVRTKLDLRQAITDMDRFAETHGTYEGFDAPAGRILDPRLDWSDGHLAPEGSKGFPPLTMSVEAAPPGTARLTALSASGTVFCIERAAGGPVRYGSAAPVGENQTPDFGRAIAGCGSTPWSEAAVRLPDTSRMCDGVDPSGGYLICRMVQVLITDTLRQTKIE